MRKINEEGLSEFIAKNSRPLLIVSNGPSVKYFRKEKIPSNTVIVRMNMFFLEKERRFGKRVDAHFMSTYRRSLYTGLETSIIENRYKIDLFFRCPDIFENTLEITHQTAARQANLFRPKAWHWDILKANESINRYINDRPLGGLPTTGMQALATCLQLGFKEIYLAGFDLYEEAIGSEEKDGNERYYFETPDFIKKVTAKEHYSGGFESKAHSKLIEVDFFRALQQIYPDASINCTNYESASSLLMPVSDIHSSAFFSPEVGHDKENDFKRFLGKYKEAMDRELPKEYGQIKYKNECLHGWFHNSKKNSSDKLNILFDGTYIKSIDSFAYNYCLELANIGDGRRAFKVPIETKDLPKEIRVISDSGYELEGSPIKINDINKYGDIKRRYLEHPRRGKHNINRNILSISENKQHDWYTDSKIEILRRRFSLSCRSQYKLKNILIIGHNFNLSTGVMRPLSHYMNIMGHCSTKNIKSVEISPEATTDDLRLMIVQSDFTIINSIYPLFHSQNLLTALSNINPNKFAIYLHETHWTLAKTQENNKESFDCFLKVGKRFNYLCVSKAQESLIKSMYGFEQCWTIYNTTYQHPRHDSYNNLVKRGTLQIQKRKNNYKKLRPKKIRDSKIRILMVGTVQERKGIELFSKTADLAKIKYPNWQFRWAGGGNSNQDDIYISPNIKFLGKLDSKKLTKEYDNMDIFFIPSLDDPFPLSLIEAIYNMKRFLMSEYVGVSEFFEGSDNIMSRYSPDAALDSLEKLLKSDIDTELCGWFSEYLNIERFVERLNSTMAKISEF